MVMFNMFCCSYTQLVCQSFSFKHHLFLFVFIAVYSAPTLVLAHNASRDQASPEINNFAIIFFFFFFFKKKKKERKCHNSHWNFFTEAFGGSPSELLHHFRRPYFQNNSKRLNHCALKHRSELS